MRVDKSAINGCQIQTVRLEGDIDAVELEKLLNRKNPDFILEVSATSEFVNLAFEGIGIVLI